MKVPKIEKRCVRRVNKRIRSYTHEWELGVMGTMDELQLRAMPECVTGARPARCDVQHETTRRSMALAIPGGRRRPVHHQGEKAAAQARRKRRNSILAAASWGWFPPFSDFFYEVLDHFGLQALHLHPNSVLILSIFAYYCEAYLGVMPSVALLRHFFFLRLTGGHISGCANFIAAGQDNSISNTGKRVDNIRAKWVMMSAKCAHPRLELPTEAP